MPFQEIFGGNNIYPSDPTFLSRALTADLELQWPLEQSIGGVAVLAAEIELTPSAAGFSVTMPDATLGSTGYTTTFYNAGADDYTVRNAGGGSLAVVGSGEAWVLWLRDNSTVNGAWRTFQLGAGTSAANASDLAGAGLVAEGITLNEEIEIQIENVDYSIVDGDRAKGLLWTGGVGEFTLPDPVTVGANWFIAIKNSGSGTLTVLPNGAETIDGSSTLTLSLEDSTWIVTDGTDWFTFGFGQATVSAFDFISIPVPGSGDYTLAGAELNRVSYEFTGILTGNRNIIVPATIQQYWVDNQTTGAFTLTIKTTLAAGSVVLQGTRNIFYCDGTDVVPAVTFSAVTFADGSLSNPSIAFTNDLNTGFYRNAGDSFVAVAGGTAIANFVLTGADPQYAIATGAVGVPSLTFVSDLDTGWYHVAANIMGFTANGADAARLGETFTVRDGAVGAPSLSFLTDTNTGFYLVAANQIGVTTDGVQRMVIGTTGGVMRIPWGFASGTAAAPGINFDSAADCGMYLPAAGQLGLAAAGRSYVLIDDNGLGSIATISIGNSAVGGNTISLVNAVVATTVGLAGGGSALPATPVGYLIVQINGSNMKIPYYNP